MSVTVGLPESDVEIVDEELWDCVSVVVSSGDSLGPDLEALFSSLNEIEIVTEGESERVDEPDVESE